MSEYSEQQQSTLNPQHARVEILKVLIENSYEMLGLLDEKARYIYLSLAANEAYDAEQGLLSGFQSSPLLGRDAFESVHADDLPRVMEEFNQVFNGKKKIHLQPYRVLDAAGNVLWLEAIVTNQLNHPGLQAIVVSARNITHQIETEQKLKALQTMQALMEGEEKERSRIARDLHDGVAGMIAAATMQFSALTERQPLLASQHEYKQGMELLQSASKLVRSTSHNLMPDVLSENGLSMALQRYCQVVSNQQLTIQYVDIGAVERYSLSFELALYRISQELIGNLVKHSGATKALVQLSHHPQLLTLSFEDNGKGFNPLQDTNGTGLKSIEKRVTAMNGKMEVDSTPGNGTYIYLEFET